MITILINIDYLQLKYNLSYGLRDFTSRLSERPNAIEKLILAFDELIGIIKQGPALANHYDTASFMQAGQAHSDSSDSDNEIFENALENLHLATGRVREGDQRIPRSIASATSWLGSNSYKISSSGAVKDERERLRRCVRNDRGNSYLNLSETHDQVYRQRDPHHYLATFIVIVAMIGRWQHFVGLTSIYNERNAWSFLLITFSELDQTIQHPGGLLGPFQSCWSACGPMAQQRHRETGTTSPRRQFGALHMWSTGSVTNSPVVRVDDFPQYIPQHQNGIPVGDSCACVCEIDIYVPCPAMAL